MISSYSLPSRLLLALLLISIPASLAAQGIESPRVPLRKAIDEIRELRESYADAFNKKDSVTVAGMYAPDAVVIRGDGSVLKGKEAIREDISSNASHWPQTTIESDTLRVFGNTAWDMGTSRNRTADGGEEVSHYLVVLRRGIKFWKVSALAVVPVRADSAPPVKMRVSADSQ